MPYIVTKKGELIEISEPYKVSKLPIPLARGLKTENSDVIKFYSLDIKNDSSLEHISRKPETFNSEDLRSAKKMIKAFTLVLKNIEKLSKNYYEDEYYIKYSTNFSMLFPDKDTDEDKDIHQKRKLFDLIRMAHNAGFYIHNGLIVCGSPFYRIRLEEIIEILFYSHLHEKEYYKGIYRQLPIYVLKVISSKYGLNIKNLVKFWAFAFYNSTNPIKDEILTSKALDKKKILPLPKF